MNDFFQGRTAIYPFTGPVPPARVKRLLTEPTRCPSGRSWGAQAFIINENLRIRRRIGGWVWRKRRDGTGFWDRRFWRGCYRNVNQHTEWWRIPDFKLSWPKGRRSSKRRRFWAGGNTGNFRRRNAHGNNLWFNSDKGRDWSMIPNRSTYSFAVDMDRMVRVMTKGRGRGRPHYSWRRR